MLTEHLRSALELMNRSVGGGAAPQPSQQEAAQAQARYQVYQHQQSTISYVCLDTREEGQNRSLNISCVDKVRLMYLE